MMLQVNLKTAANRIICAVQSTKSAIIFGLMIIASATTLFSQSQTQEIQYDEILYVELDPLAFIHDGYSFHLGYENWGYRFDLTKVKVDFPESFEEAFYKTKAFDLVTHISGVKMDYIGNRSNWTKNAFIGLDINHQKLSFEHRATGSIKDLNTFNIGLRTGYKLPIFKGLYITPWAALWRNVATKQEYIVETDKVTTNDWDWIVTLHFGYAYKF